MGAARLCQPLPVNPVWGGETAAVSVGATLTGGATTPDYASASRYGGGGI